ncbi:microcephalin-like [Styela clava]
MQNRIFNTSAAPDMPVVPKQNIPMFQTKQAIASIESPAKNTTPVINKLLNLGIAEQNIMSDSSSPDSPLSNSAQKKLRDLPHTTTLCGCVAFVDVWSSDATDNRSCVFRNFLTRMGATVVRKFTKEHPITHVVFKDGHKSVIQKAQKRNIKLVTCLWVDRCRVLQKWVNEEDYLFDVSKYKPPKRFYEMQPQEPEDAIRKSAERLKRRKARFDKKHARIMFQSPLVTNSRSANNTPDAATPSNPAFNRKYGILAADTPFHPPSPYRFLNPSIVYETPISDSMQRMMKRMKEGKHIFSPPSSDNEDEKENCEKMSVNDNSSDKPTNNAFSIIHAITPEPEREKFSPIADTQCFVKRSWRESGLSPPRFDASLDEIPETQQMEAPDTPDQARCKIIHPALPEGFNEVPETQHMNISLPSPNAETHLKGIEQPETSLCNVEGDLSKSSLENQQQLKRTQLTISQDSVSDLHLHVSGSSIESIHDSTSKHKDEPNLTNIETATTITDVTPTEQKIYAKPFVSSRRKKRKLLDDDECLEPVSILLSPQESARKSKSILSTQEPTNIVSRNGTSMLLPQLGLSAYKTATESGRFFGRICSNTPSECSVVSEKSAIEQLAYNSQSTDFEDEDEANNKNKDKQHALCDNNEIPLINQQLSLYDRIKMREKRNSTSVDSFISHSTTEPSRKRRRRVSENSCQSSSPRSQRKISRTQPNKNIFSSQAAKAICESFTRRRSTMDFTTPILGDPTQFASSYTKKKNIRKSVIVLTNFHSGERFELHKAVRTLSGFRITSIVRDQTTHVVCGAARRTMNVLRAIAKGLWLLSKNWVTDSISAGFWLEEESYEIYSIFPAARKNRKCRSRNSIWENNLFAKFDGHIYISDDTKPSQDDLRELVSLCGGRIVGSSRRASVCVGNPGRTVKDIPVVNETWVLDCVSENCLLPMEKYLIPF